MEALVDSDRNCDCCGLFDPERHRKESCSRCGCGNKSQIADCSSHGFRRKKKAITDEHRYFIGYDRIPLDFLNKADANKVDIGCISKMKPAPFFLKK